MLYPRLAIRGMKKNVRFYFPYFLTCILTAALFYIILFLLSGKNMPGGPVVMSILALGAIVIGIFSAAILFYTNSFLMKQRKKEFGLYNVLGMEKRHIFRVLICESFFSFVITAVLGVLSGMLMSKFFLLGLCRLVGFSAPAGFEISLESIVITVVLFAVIFLFLLLTNLVRVGRASAIDLLHGSSVGEKEPKSKWFLAILGLLCLAGGYLIANVVNQPVQALAYFFLAVMLVIIGTYLLFVAGSIAILKALKKNKSYYYKTSHFTSVSGMLYRMKQNAAGLATICILSTMVLVVISTTVCLNSGVDSAINNIFPNEVAIELKTGDTAHVSRNDTESPLVKRVSFLSEAAKELGEKQSVPITEENIHFSSIITPSGNGTDEILADGRNIASHLELMLITAEEYKAVTGNSVSLGENEVLHLFGTAQSYSDVTLFGKEYKVFDNLPRNESFAMKNNTIYDETHMYLVFRDAEAVSSILSIAHAAGIGVEQNAYIGLELDGSMEQKNEFFAAFLEGPASSDPIYKIQMSIDSRSQNRQDFDLLYGGLLFLGLFLGAAFLIATVLIIYYKQISEGYDDVARFDIMKKVGLSHAEVRKTIKSQVLTVFFLPLLVSVIHIIAAFNMLKNLLSIFQLTDINLFFICCLITVLIFSVFYTITYAITARSYYKIVQSAG